jgi:hypothetical protein
MLKKKEYSKLLHLLGDKNLSAQAKGLVDKIHSQLKFAYEIPQESGTPKLSSIFQNELNKAKDHRPDFCRKAMALGFARHSRDQISREKKLATKKDIDVRMQDLTSNNLQEVVKQAVAAALQQKKNKQPNKQGTTSSSSKNLPVLMLNSQTQTQAPDQQQAN